MNYFSKVTHNYSTKNRLQEQVEKVFFEEDQKIIYSKEVFLERLQKRVDQLNRAFPRCTPIKVTLWEGHNRINEQPTAYTISASDLITITLYVVKNPQEALPEKPKRAASAPDGTQQLNLLLD